MLGIELSTLCIRMYVCLYVCKQLCVSIYEYVHLQTKSRECMSVFVHVCTVCMYVCMYVCIYICTFECMCSCSRLTAVDQMSVEYLSHLSAKGNCSILDNIFEVISHSDHRYVHMYVFMYVCMYACTYRIDLLLPSGETSLVAKFLWGDTATSSACLYFCVFFLFISHSVRGGIFHTL